MYSGRKDDLLVQVLPVDNVSKNHSDVNRLPTSGSEYLQRVRAEARQYEDVKVAGTVKKNMKQNILKISEEKVVTDPKLLPSLHWQNEQIREFSRVRLKYEEYKLANKDLTEKKKTIKRSSSKEICFTFLYGNADKHREGHEPLISTLMFFDQMLVGSLLEMHVDWMATVGFSHCMGRWLYSLLVVFEKPLTPDACWMLRRLAKQCHKTRSSIGEESGELSGVNLIICLIARYFDQADLVDQLAVQSDLNPPLT